MSIAGLAFLVSPKLLEAVIVLSTADYIRYSVAKIKRAAVVSESTGGRIKSGSMPCSFLARIISPLHGLAFFVPPLIYVGASVLNRFQPPEWMARFALPGTAMELQNASRVVACAASFSLRLVTNSTFEHLGDQWHVIGRREKPRVVKTGPYAWVRHPGYSSVLAQQALWSIMFWSYIPLVTLGVTAIAFAVKMPIEESLIQQDVAIRDEYRLYMKEVPSRILPYVW